MRERPGLTALAPARAGRNGDRHDEAKGSNPSDSSSADYAERITDSKEPGLFDSFSEIA